MHNKNTPAKLSSIIKKILVYAGALLLLTILIPNWIILSSSKKLIPGDINKIEKADVGIILGAAVYSGKRVSPVVYDRIESAVKLYKKGKIDKLLISGDHRERYYDEVNTIKYWLLKNNVPLSDIYMDHSGFSTYESIYRAHNLFNVESAVIITQSFHLPRALYLARYWGISVQGYAADQRMYKNARWFMIREFFARVKDYFYIHGMHL